MSFSEVFWSRFLSFSTLELLHVQVVRGTMLLYIILAFDTLDLRFNQGPKNQGSRWDCPQVYRSTKICLDMHTMAVTSLVVLWSLEKMLELVAWSKPPVIQCFSSFPKTLRLAFDTDKENTSGSFCRLSRLITSPLVSFSADACTLSHASDWNSAESFFADGVFLLGIQRTATSCSPKTVAGWCAANFDRIPSLMIAQ